MARSLPEWVDLTACSLSDGLDISGLISIITSESNDVHRGEKCAVPERMRRATSGRIIFSWYTRRGSRARGRFVS